MAVPHPFFDGLTPTLHIAHRGGAALAPENTLAAFELAVSRYRTQMLELDVQRTRDGVWVVAHDNTVDRCTDGSGDIAALTLEEVQRLDAGHRFTPDGGRSFPFRSQGVGIPTLREVLERFPEMRINVDVKRAPEGTLPSFADALRAPEVSNRVCCGSESDALAAQLHALLPSACHFYPRDALAEFVLAIRMGAEPPIDPRFTVLAMPLYFADERLIDAALLDAAERHHRWVNVWTVDDPSEMRRLVDEGVGGIMTDRPDVLRTVLDERRS
jgi:glycerophosphoryl diester phosphodiesterase